MSYTRNMMPGMGKTMAVRKGHRRDKFKKATYPGRADGKIRVRLDSRTVITVASMKAFDFWKERYPNAVVLPEAHGNLLTDPR